MAQVQLVVPEVAAAPLSYTVPAQQEIIPLAVAASFDGSGAAAAYVPTLRILSDSGHVIADCPLTSGSIAAGASADMSWFPGGRVGASTGNGYIKFDYDNQGGYLDVTANDLDGSGYGIHFDDKSGGTSLYESESTLRVQGGAGGAFIDVDDTHGGITLSLNGATAPITVQLAPDSGSPALFGLLRVLDDAGSPVFEVRDNGSVHILTGTTVQADL